jgi:hypothetical protein
MFSLSPREARVGREPERGAIQEKLLLSPALSPSCVGKRGRRPGAPEVTGRNARTKSGGISPPLRVEERAGERRRL